MLPFERNRYYVGKLLTSADFAAEQTYHNNKRRFINSVMFGAGVVCGLSVYNLDDLSIMVESGVAVDGTGREIVVENAVVRKLSAIDGFEGLQSGRASLCLRYKEEAVHPVYSVNRQEKSEEYEYNRIAEGWQLFLVDTEELEAGEGLGVEDEFLTRSRLYGDGDYNVDLMIPSNVSSGQPVRLRLEIEKVSEEERTLELDCTLQTPAFTDSRGEHEIEIRTGEVKLAQGEKVVRDYWLRAREEEELETTIIAKTSFVKLQLDGQEMRIQDNFMLKLSIVGAEVKDLVAREAGKESLESRSLAGPMESIRLADFTLVRTESAYLIDGLREMGVKQYLLTAAEERRRREYSEWFAGGGERSSAPAAEPAVEAEPSVAYREPVYATGLCEIPLGANMRRGEIEYSDEIMHGLGKGNVFVKIGFEYLAEDPKLGVTAKNTIYGDAELFMGEEPPIPYVQTAVRVMNDRGSFVVAAKLLKETNYVLLVLRWVAIKLPAGDEAPTVQKMAGKSIAAEQPTVVLATRESHYFNVRFRNMEPCTLTYELTEKDSGEITPDGIYTAPAKEGVYEIRISCADMPLISTYAYAVVKKRGIEGEEEGAPEGTKGP